MRIDSGAIRAAQVRLSLQTKKRFSRVTSRRVPHTLILGQQISTRSTVGDLLKFKVKGRMGSRCKYKDSQDLSVSIRSDRDLLVRMQGKTAQLRTGSLGRSLL